MTYQAFTHHGDVFDIRDVIERFEELESTLESAFEQETESGETSLGFDEWIDAVIKDQSAAHAHEYWDEASEYQVINRLLDSVRGYGGDEQWRGDWYPVTFIADEYFTEYAIDMLKDCGGLPANIPHYIVIDEEATAKNIQQDYSPVEIEGFIYWYR